MIAAIDKQILHSRERVVEDTIRLVRIKSVADPSSPNFGEGPRKVLDTLLHMAQQEGFYCTDYGCGVISVALKEGPPDVGIWLHGDVVPEGDGWMRDPYDAYVHNDCIIGRGVTDNKGQISAMFHLLRLLKNSGIALRYNPALYIGSCEECGMHDVIAFLQAHTPPTLSLVPDDGFPVGYGGKGGMHLVLQAESPLAGWSLTAGQPQSPGTAVAVLANGEQITVHTPPRHASTPDPNGNMITKICATLLEQGVLPAQDRRVAEFLQMVSLDVNGKELGIATQHDTMGDLTVFSKSVDCEDGMIRLTINIRYPVGITCEAIAQQVHVVAERYGFQVSSILRGVDPYLLDPHGEVVTLLHDCAEDVIGDGARPFTLGGGTYAHRLPNAYVFGTDANVPPADFEKGRGGAHGIDEAASIDRLLRAMRIYARALLRLNEQADTLF